MAVGLFETIVATSILFLSLYYYLTSNLNYWKKRGVAGPKPIAFFGNYKEVILGKTNEVTVLDKVYNEYKNEAFIGIYIKNNPSLVIRDSDLIKDVLIRDFNIFPDREIFKLQKTTNMLHANIFNLEYKRWKPLRTKLTPIFSSTKLKHMFYLITECANKFQKYIERLIEINQVVECTDLTAKFTTDTIGICVFGLKMGALDDENSRFRNFGKSVFSCDFQGRLKKCLRQYFPAIYDLIDNYVQFNSGSKFFIDTMKDTMAYRKQNNIRRNDILDLLMDLKEDSPKSNDFDITDNVIIAQSFIFFMAGFETSSTTISNTLYELALNPSIQYKLRKEILEELDKNNGKLTYDCLKNMSYLDKIIKESLRKYPVAPFLRRKAASPYTFNYPKGPIVTIPKDMKLTIPVWSIHRDPDIYPDPETFDPQRFTEENEKIRHSMHYLPFGDGPHNCIGWRFAHFQIKIGVVVIVEKFQVNVCDKTCTEYHLKPRALVATPAEGLFLQISKI